MSRFLSVTNHIRDALWPNTIGLGAGSSERSRGAAVLIGAGMSRNASHFSSSGEAPLWADLSAELVAELCPGDSEASQLARQRLLQETGAVSGFLRLAERFEARFGRATLNEFLTKAISDSRMEPSEMHLDLMRLPWIDVYTTNWDTLIERAAQRQSVRSYEPVYSPSDIPLTARPRIFKLHGTMPYNKPFIFTEEDFRLYHRDFAAFVNAVQQSMMENVFVLIGFGGDDPNFLKWGGWVRDNLSASSPKIFMVNDFKGAEDSIEIMGRLNIVPVDLSCVPEDLPESFEEVRALYPSGFQQRLGAWLRYLQFAERTSRRNWPGQANVGGTPDWRNAPSHLDKIRHFVHKMRENRQNYPGWVVAPADSRDAAYEKTGDFFQTLMANFSNSMDLDQSDEPISNGSKLNKHAAIWAAEVLKVLANANDEHVLRSGLSALDEVFDTEPDALTDVAGMLFEVLWRLKTSMHPWPRMSGEVVYRLVSTSWLQCNEGERSSWPDGSVLLRFAKDKTRARQLAFDLAVILVSVLRETSGLTDRFHEIAQTLLEKFHAEQLHAEYNRVLYECCLRALDRGDIQNLRILMRRWYDSSKDPLCRFRRSGLLGVLDADAQSEEFLEDRHRLLNDAYDTCRKNMSLDQDSYEILSRESWLLAYFEEVSKNYRPQRQAHGRGGELRQVAFGDYGERLDDLTAVRCDPRRELRRIERNLSDVETVRSGAAVLDTVGWPLRESRLRPVIPNSRYRKTDQLHAKRFAVSLVLTNLDAARKSIGNENDPYKVDQLTSQAVATLFRCKLGHDPDDFRFRKHWVRIASDLEFIGEHLAKARIQEGSKPGRTVALAIDGLEAASNMLRLKDDLTYSDAPDRFIKAVFIVGALGKRLAKNTRSKSGQVTDLVWPSDLTRRALRVVVNAATALIESDARLKRHADKKNVPVARQLGIQLEQMIGLVQRQAMVQQFDDKSAIMEEMLQLFWDIPLAGSPHMTDPLSLVQQVTNEIQVDDRECKCLVTATNRDLEALSHSQKERLIRLYDSARDLGFDVKSVKPKMAELIKQAFNEDGDTLLKPWEWLLLAEVDRPAETRFRNWVIAEIKEADPETGFIREPIDTARLLKNLAWAMRHDRIKFRLKSAKDIKLLLGWLRRLAEKQGTSLTDEMKDAMAAIFLRRIATENEQVDKADTSLILDTILAMYMAGIRVEDQVPEIAALLRRRNEETSTRPLASLLRDGLASNDLAEFERALSAALVWLERSAESDGRAAAPVPSTLLGALGQALVVRDTEHQLRVLAAIDNFLDKQIERGASVAVEFLPMLRDKVNEAITNSNPSPNMREHLRSICRKLEPQAEKITDDLTRAAVRALLEQLHQLDNDSKLKGKT